MHKYNIKPQTIKAVCFDMQWKPKVKTKVTNSINNTIMDTEHDNPDVKVFTDGSDMEGKIGMAAVLHRNGRMKTKLQYQLGSQHQHTVYCYLRHQISLQQVGHTVSHILH